MASIKVGPQFRTVFTYRNVRSVYIAVFIVLGRRQSQSVVFVGKNVFVTVEQAIVWQKGSSKIRVLFLLRYLVELEEQLAIS